MVRYEQLSFWVNRIGAVFTVGFSVVFLVLLGASAGNRGSATWGTSNWSSTTSPPSSPTGSWRRAFTTLAISLVVRRETGLLKRLRLSPLPTWVLISPSSSAR